MTQDLLVMTGLQRHMHCAQLAKGKYMCGQQQMLSRLDMMQQASSSTDIWLLREAPCVRGADINSSCDHFYKHECCTKMGALQHFLRLCGSPVVAMSNHSTTLGVACSCQSCLRSCCETFPASTIYQHQHGPWLQFQRGCHAAHVLCSPPSVGVWGQLHYAVNKVRPRSQTC